MGMRGVSPQQCVIKSLNISSGTSTIWTPANGLRFVLWGYSILPSGAATSIGVDVQLVDNATVIVTHTYALSGLTELSLPTLVISLAPGEYVSIADNNPLRVRLGSAVTAGRISVSVWGVER